MGSSMPPAGFGADGRPLTIEAAHRAINEIRSARGHIDAIDKIEIAKTSPEWRDRYLRNAETQRKVYARYTKTSVLLQHLKWTNRTKVNSVAEQLYSSKFRLIHELLQNADDAEYAAGVAPCITFTIKPSELVVESNEAGFTLSNVQAICATGESSKTDDNSTTGEKGLGFKSVFGIANNVHIRSGCWSFKFQHTRGEDGVGMVTPMWTEVNSDPLPPGIGTRYNLGFSDTSDTFIRRIVEEFERLPNTIIFALRRLKKVTVVFDNAGGRYDMAVFDKQGSLDSYHMSIGTTIDGRFGDHRSGVTDLKVFQKIIPDMPFDELRRTDQSTVTLAFEVDANGVPIIPSRGQHVFAYLPVHRLPQLPVCLLSLRPRLC
jgi:hypothetical protein